MLVLAQRRWARERVAKGQREMEVWEMAKEIEARVTREIGARVAKVWAAMVGEKETEEGNQVGSD